MGAAPTANAVSQQKGAPTADAAQKPSAKAGNASPTAGDRDAARQQSTIAALAHSLESDGHHHHGEGQDEPPPTEEELTRRKELGELTDARLSALATYLKALVDGKSDAEALKMAGVPVTELDRISFLSERYYPARAAALDMEAELAALKKAPAPASPKEANAKTSKERLLARQLDAHQRFKAQYFKQVSPEVQALVQKREPEFVAIVKAQWARRDKVKAEARALAVKEFSDKSIPGLVAYLDAKSKGVSERAAIKASGLSEQMVVGMSILASEYGAPWLNAKRAGIEIPKAKARMEEKKKAGQNTSFEERLIQEYEGQVAAYGKFRTSFAQANGQALEKALADAMETVVASYGKHEEFKTRE